MLGSLAVVLAVLHVMADYEDALYDQTLRSFNLSLQRRRKSSRCSRSCSPLLATLDPRRLPHGYRARRLHCLQPRPDTAAEVGGTRARISWLLEEHPTGTLVTLRADKTLEYGKVMGVMGELNHAGFNAISLVTDRSVAAP